MHDSEPTKDARLLSPALKSVWAKTGLEDGDPYANWLPLVGHAMDAAGVAGELWDEWLSESQKATIADCFLETETPSTDQARTFATLAAAIHDIGKISKPFARQAPRLADRMSEHGLRTASRDTEEAATNRWMRHELAGAVAIRRAGPTLGWDPAVSAALSTLAGGHHGIPTQRTQLGIARRERLHYLVEGGSKDPWSDAQVEFAQFTAKLTDAPVHARPKFTAAALVILQGLVITSDWISSSTEFFPLTRIDDRDLTYLKQEGGQEARLESALASLQLPSTWKPQDLGTSATSLLRSRLGLPFEARPLQEAAVEAARRLPSPGMLIIEDAMGAGKTEAALLAAEILAARFGANGLLIALPTQATTDAMFTRMLSFLEVGLDSPGEASRNDRPNSVALLHGRAGWNKQADDLKYAGRAFLDRVAGSFDVEMGNGHIELEDVHAEPKVLTHPWLRGRNKTILSSFVATTVDHLLMGALQMKHLALRHLGLSSKVIIFDEVHASSRFMNFFAERVLQWLGAYQVPVIMLSATLDSSLRERLTSAYQEGLCSTLRTPRAQRVGAVQHGSEKEGAKTSDRKCARPAVPNNPYPRLTRVDAKNVLVVPVDPATETRTVSVMARGGSETPASVAKELARDREGNILVLVNTVSRAQNTYAELSALYGTSVRLVHARFTAADRLENDQWLLHTYGPDSPARPNFSIVVATQVVEQSLDVDFDVIVTDVAPVDLVLQRVGRVHRHPRPHRPGPFANAQCHLVGAPKFGSPPDLNEKALSAATKIYGQWPVLSGLLALGEEIFSPGGARITLPEQIGPLVEASASGDFTTPPTWSAALEVAGDKWRQEGEEAAAAVAQTRLAPPTKRLGRLPTLDDWYGMTDEAGEGPARVARGKVRDGLEGLDVVLLNRVGGDVYTMPNSSAPDGLRLPLDVAPDAWLARQALLGTVALPAWAATNLDEVVTDLEQRCWGPGLEDSYLLGGELLLPLEDGETELAGYRYRYSRETGLEVQRDR